MQTKEVKIKGATIRLLTSNIVENIIDDYSSLDGETVTKIKSENKKLTHGIRYGVLVDSGMFTTISKEARELSASKDFASNTVAKALFVRSLGHRIVGKFYLSINKPYIKTKIFSDRNKAIEWLKIQVKNNLN